MATTKPKTRENRPEFVTLFPIGEIHASPLNPRKHFDAAGLEELAASIREQGLIQPVIVRKAAPHLRGYEIIAGERRIRAAQLAGLVHVPAIVRDCTDLELLEAAMAENIRRRDLTALEEARGYHALLGEGKTQTEVAAMFGAAQSTIANALRLLALPPRAMQLLETGVIGKAQAQQLYRFRESPAYCEWLAEKVARDEVPEKLLRDGAPFGWEPPRTVLVPLLNAARFDYKERCPGCVHLHVNAHGHHFCGNPGLFDQHQEEAQEAAAAQRVAQLAATAGVPEMTGALTAAAGVGHVESGEERDAGYQEGRERRNAEAQAAREIRTAEAQTLYQDARIAVLGGMPGSREAATLVWQTFQQYQVAQEDIAEACAAVGRPVAEVWPDPDQHEEPEATQLSRLGAVPLDELLKIATLAQLAADRNEYIRSAYGQPDLTRWYLGRSEAVEVVETPDTPDPDAPTFAAWRSGVTDAPLPAEQCPECGHQRDTDGSCPHCRKQPAADPAASTGPEPNPAGVYDESAAEVALRIADKKTTCLVRLLETRDGWVFACDLSGPGHGTSTPLKAETAVATRSQALSGGYEMARRFLTELGDRGQSKALTESARRLLGQVEDAIYALDQYEASQRRMAEHSAPTAAARTVCTVCETVLPEDFPDPASEIQPGGSLLDPRGHLSLKYGAAYCRGCRPSAILQPMRLSSRTQVEDSRSGVIYELQEWETRANGGAGWGAVVLRNPGPSGSGEGMETFLPNAELQRFFYEWKAGVPA